jgi:hypothetical protein
VAAVGARLYLVSRGSERSPLCELASAPLASLCQPLQSERASQLLQLACASAHAQRTATVRCRHGSPQAWLAVSPPSRLPLERCRPCSAAWEKHTRQGGSTSRAVAALRWEPGCVHRSRSRCRPRARSVSLAGARTRGGVAVVIVEARKLDARTVSRRTILLSTPRGRGWRMSGEGIHSN